MTSTTNDMYPEHHVHRADEPLPGARGGAGAADYNPETIERMPSSAWEDSEEQPASEAPDVKYAAPAGASAQGGGPKASATDKIVGKGQKIIGKVTHNPELHDKGTLRETSGKP